MYLVLRGITPKMMGEQLFVVAEGQEKQEMMIDE